MKLSRELRFHVNATLLYCSDLITMYEDRMEPADEEARRKALDQLEGSLNAEHPSLSTVYLVRPVPFVDWAFILLAAALNNLAERTASNTTVHHVHEERAIMRFRAIVEAETPLELQLVNTKPLLEVITAACLAYGMRGMWFAYRVEPGDIPIVVFEQRGCKAPLLRVPVAAIEHDPLLHVWSAKNDTLRLMDEAILSLELLASTKDAEATQLRMRADELKIARGARLATAQK